MRNISYTPKLGKTKSVGRACARTRTVLTLLLLCTFAPLSWAQSGSVVNELVVFGKRALDEEWGHAAKLVLQAAVEQAPNHAEASRLYPQARTLASQQPLGNMSMRIALLNAALDAHERSMFRATKILLLELQRLEPGNEQVQRLLEEVNAAIRGGAPAVSSRSLTTPASSSTVTTTSRTSTQQTTTTRSTQTASAYGSGTSGSGSASSTTQTSRSSTTAPSSQTRTATATRTNSNMPETSGTSQENPSTTAPAAEHSPELPRAAHGTPDMLPINMRGDDTALSPQTEQPVTERVSLSQETAFAPSHNKHVSANPNEYPDYERPYVIPAYQDTSLEKAEIDIITEWRNSMHVQRVVENADKSVIQINNQAYRLGEIVLKDYYVFWRGLNPQTRTLYFVDRRGHIYKKRY